MMRLAALLVLVACSDTPTTFWVSPTGDDANPGTEDAPFASLTRARDAVRDAQPSHAIVIVRGGRYELTETFELDARDSNVTYRAADGEAPVLSGGRFVAGWEPGPN